MATIKLDMTAIRERSASELAKQLGCTAPDSLDSFGAKLLTETRDRVLTHVKEVLAVDYEPREVIETNRRSDITDTVLPEDIDNDRMWRQFVDLGGWQNFWQDFNQETLRHLVDKFRNRRELPCSEDLPTMTELARSALYMIVDGLVGQLVEELQQQYDAIEPDEEDYDA
jgi:hypothetical protein